MKEQINYFKVFNLPENFNHEDLEKAYNVKLSEIQNTNLSELDKQIYLEHLYKYYTIAKRDIRRRYLREEYKYGYDGGYGHYGYGSSFGYEPFSFFRNFQNNIDRLFNYDFNNFGDGYGNGHRQISQYQHFERRLDDGSYVVTSRESNNINGTETIKDENYIRKRDGNKEYITSDKAKELIGSNGITNNLLK